LIQVIKAIINPVRVDYTNIPRYIDTNYEHNRFHMSIAGVQFDLSWALCGPVDDDSGVRYE